ncbi:hypothetical protein HDU93_005310, partial [Gonapodya sp. JEL0774]
GDGIARGAWELATPRVVVVAEVAKELVAWPGPGWVDMGRLVEWTRTEIWKGPFEKQAEEVNGDTTPSIELEAAMRAFESSNLEVVQAVLRHRARTLQELVRNLRAMIPDVSLPLPAPDLRIAFLDVVHTPSLRRLTFANQLERSVRMTAMRRERCASGTGWGDGRLVELECVGYRRVEATKLEYVFAVRNGLEFVEVDSQVRLGKWLLVRDKLGEAIPLEVRFDDAAWHGAVSLPKSWNEDVDVETLARLTFANAIEILNGWKGGWRDKVTGQLKQTTDTRTCVVLDLPYKRKEFDVKVGGIFRLVERFVDFNLKKVLESLVETELLREGRPNGENRRPLFIQLLEDPNRLGLVNPVEASVVKEDLDNFERTTRFFNEQWQLRGAELGNDAVRLRQSQARAFRGVLRNTVTIIW